MVLPSPFYSGGNPIPAGLSDRAGWQRLCRHSPAATHLQCQCLLFLLCSHQVGGQLSDMLPGPLHMSRFHSARADGKTQHKLLSEVTWNQVDFLGAVYSFQETFIQFVGTLKGSRERGGAQVPEDSSSNDSQGSPAFSNAPTYEGEPLSHLPFIHNGKTFNQVTFTWP